MKSKPVVMDHFSTVHTSFIVDFSFTNNITILTGDSGTGKTASFQMCIRDRYETEDLKLSMKCGKVQTIAVSGVDMSAQAVVPAAGDMPQ